MKKIIIVMVSIVLSLYLAAAFVFLSFNLIDWGVTGRIGVCVFLLVSWGWVIDQYRANAK